jgi:hypothetical protein
VSLNNNINFELPHLPQTIIWPDNPDDIPWFMVRLYEQIAYSVNARDFDYFQMAISGSPSEDEAPVDSTYVLIPNMNTIGAYTLCISGSGPYIDVNGEKNYWPSQIIGLCKSDPDDVGTDATLQSVDGVGPTLSNADYQISWARNPRTATSGPYFAYIKHNKAGITGSFNVNIDGTF